MLMAGGKCSGGYPSERVEGRNGGRWRRAERFPPLRAIKTDQKKKKKKMVFFFKGLT